MLRDAATDVFNLQYALLEKYGLATIEGVFFRGKLIFQVIVHMKDKSIHRALHLFKTTVRTALLTSLVLNFFSKTVKKIIKKSLKKSY